MSQPLSKHITSTEPLIDSSLHIHISNKTKWLYLDVMRADWDNAEHNAAFL